MVLLAVRGLDRIEQLEQQLAAMTAGSGEPAKRAALDSHSVRSSTIPADPQIAPVIVGGVDVAPLATAANIVGLVESAPSDEGATEGAALRASLRMARVLVQERSRSYKRPSRTGCAMKGRGKARTQPRPARRDPQALLRELQKALAVARCIRLAAEYGEDDALDIADALAGLLILDGC